MHAIPNEEIICFLIWIKWFITDKSVTTLFYDYIIDGGRPDYVPFFTKKEAIDCSSDFFGNMNIGNSGYK